MGRVNKPFEVFKDKFIRFPEKTALIITDKKISYQELSDRVDTWANFFASIGVKAGERVILSTDHRFDFVASWLSLWKMEAVPIPMEPISGCAELDRAIDAGKPHWICSENGEHSKSLSIKAEKFVFNLQPSWIIAKTNIEVDVDSMSDSAFYAYTSGTTGSPKCVMYDNDATIAILEALIDAFKLTGEDVFTTPLTPSLPSVIFTAILPALAAGATLVLLNEPIPSQALKVMTKTKTSVFFAVPYFYKLLIDAIKIREFKDFDSLRLCVSTSAYLDKYTFNDFYNLTGVPIRSIFCSSEAFYCTFNSNDDIVKLGESVGTPQKGVNIRIVDKEGKDVEPLKEGEIIVSGTHRSKGYFCRPELEAKVYKDGWVYTGDLGYMDAEGYLYITGRISHTVNVGGHLVNPQEVETVLTSYPGISEALMIGESDPRVGEIVIAKVVLKDGVDIDEEDIIQYCKKMLSHYKVPSRIEVIESLPKSRYGKVRRLA